MALSSELTFPRNVYDQLHGLLRKYITLLVQNINDRFADTKQMLQAFSIFFPPVSQRRSSLVSWHTVTSTLQPLLTACMKMVTPGIKKLNSRHSR